VKLPTPYVCDECGRQKTESNHWFIQLTGPDVFTLTTWEYTEPDTRGARHLCSESCSSKALSKWTGSLPSANAEKSQATNVPAEERQTMNERIEALMGDKRP